MRGGGFEEPDMTVVDVIDMFLGYRFEDALVVSNGLRRWFGDRRRKAAVHVITCKSHSCNVSSWRISGTKGANDTLDFPEIIHDRYQYQYPEYGSQTNAQTSSS